MLKMPPYLASRPYRALATGRARSWRRCFCPLQHIGATTRVYFFSEMGRDSHDGFSRVRDPRDTGCVTPPIYNDGVDDNARRLPGGKAPGPDGIANEILKIFVREDPGVFLSLFNVCWGCATFPARWERVRVVQLYKGNNKPLSEPSSFRPINLIDSIVKLFEKMVLGKLNGEVFKRGGLSIRQQGFKIGSGTVDAIKQVVGIAEDAKLIRRQKRKSCLMVTLDVGNAFNAMAWSAIDKVLRRKKISSHMVRILRSRMLGREFIVSTSEWVEIIAVYTGVPQSWVLGPALWNVFYDDVFRMDQKFHAREETGGLCGRLGGAGQWAGDFGFRIRAWMPGSGWTENLENVSLLVRHLLNNTLLGSFSFYSLACNVHIILPY